MGAAGDALTLRLQETVRFALEVERHRTGAAIGARGGAVAWIGVVAALGVLGALAITAPWLLPTLSVVGGGGAVIGGGLGLADPSVSALLPRRLTPVRLIGAGVALLAVGLWIDLSG